jgi:hypothetical protein
MAASLSAMMAMICFMDGCGCISHCNDSRKNNNSKNWQLYGNIRNYILYD